MPSLMKLERKDCGHPVKPYENAVMKLAVAFLLLAANLSAQAIEITIAGVNPERELQAKEMLHAVRIAHDLSKWEFTKKVTIKSKVIPHSHPVLTLNTRYNDAVDLLLSTYLHEQIHWFVAQNPNKEQAAIEDLRKLFPKVPVGQPEGARDEKSTYLHLIVCFLELEATAELLSDQRQQALIKHWRQDHYTWVYTQVVEKSESIKAILKNHGLLL
jgi:hypothetical protein